VILTQYDVVVLGAGAAGMMFAIEAGKRGRSVLVLDHADAAGEKIRISGGGRCNFTNMRTAPEHFLSDNPRFCISALRRYTPKDFVAMVERHNIAFHEKALGQLFCDGSAGQIIRMLLEEMDGYGVKLRLKSVIEAVEKTDEGYRVTVEGMDHIHCASVVVATGGKSIPKMGATGFGYDLAKQFGLRLTNIRPALVPLTFEIGLLERLSSLSGVSLDAVIASGKIKFAEAMLFTHRGLSGPSILQISSYWREGDEIVLDMAPGIDLFEELRRARTEQGRQAIHTVLGHFIPKRLAQLMADLEGASGPIGDFSDKRLRVIANAIKDWHVKPVGSEGYRTAEVTLGGVDTRDLESRTLEAKDVKGLYFIGEVVDVTGWLGGYNFQWAWASGWSAGQTV
jgi:predicted Rossmann fold flavoprotein